MGVARFLAVLALAWVLLPLAEANAQFVGALSYSHVPQAAPAVVPLSTGKDTPAGFGGWSNTDLGAAPNATLNLGQVTDTGGNLVRGVFVQDGDKLIVPAGTYGTAPPGAFSGCPTPNDPVNPTAGWCFTAQIVADGFTTFAPVYVYPARAYWTTRCFTVNSTPACTDQATTPDSISHSEISTLVTGNYAGVAWPCTSNCSGSGNPVAEALVQRNTPCTAIGCGQGFSPYGQVFKLLMPASHAYSVTAGTEQCPSDLMGNTAKNPCPSPYGGQVTIAAEHPHRNDPWGQVEISVPTGMGDAELRFGTQNIRHYVNARSMSINSGGQPGLWGLNTSRGWGLTVDGDWFATGVDLLNAGPSKVKNPDQVAAVYFQYEPGGWSSGTTVSCGITHTSVAESSCPYATVKNAVFWGGYANAILVGDNNNKSGGTGGSQTGAPEVCAVMTDNLVMGQLQDALRPDPCPYTTVLRNTVFWPSPADGQHPDCIQIFPGIHGYVLTSSGDYEENVCARGKLSLGQTISDNPSNPYGTFTNVSAGTGGGAPANYSNVPLECVSGGCLTQAFLGAVVTVTIGQVSPGVNGVTALHSYQNEGNSTGFSDGDVATLDGVNNACCVSLTGSSFTVHTWNHRADFQGAVFANSSAGHDVSNGMTVAHNLTISTMPDASIFTDVNSIILHNSIDLSDVQAAQTPGPGGSAYGSVTQAGVPVTTSTIQTKAAATSPAGADFDGSAANAYAITAQGTPHHCLAGSWPTTGSPACTVVSTAYAAGQATGYQQIAPNYDITKLPTDYSQFRAAALAMVTPCRSGTVGCGSPSDPTHRNPADNGSGNWNWLEWPPDVVGQVCWAVYGTAFDPTKNCVTQLGSKLAQ